MAITNGDIVIVIAGTVIFTNVQQQVYHFRFDGTSVDDEDAMLDFGTFLEGEVYAPLLAHISNDMSFDSIKARNISDDSDVGETGWPEYNVGQATGDVLPLAVSALITLPTSQLRVRGRKFFGGFTEPDQSDSLWGSSFVDDLIAAGTPLLSPFTGGASGLTWTPGVVTGLGVFRTFQDVLVSNIPSYQRRRKQGVGI